MLTEAKSALRAARTNEALEVVLNEMLEANEQITARSVAKKHPELSSASSITRNPKRRAMVADFRARQIKFQKLAGRHSSNSVEKLAMTITERDARISELEQQVEALQHLHMAMLQVVGELGGTSKLLTLYDGFRDARDRLQKLKVLPSTTVMSLR